MATAIRTIGHEDRLSLVDHLEELRTRLIVSGAVLAVAFGVCLWQNHALLQVINKPLKVQTRKQVVQGRGNGRPGGRRPAGSAGRSRRTRRPRWGMLARARQRPIRPGARPAEAADRRAEGRRRQDPAQPRGQQPGDPRYRRAVHDDDHRDAVLRSDRLAARDPVRALRLHPARAQSPRAARGDAAAERGPGPVRGRRGVWVLRRTARRGAVLRELQLRRVQRPGPGESRTTASPRRSCSRWGSCSRSPS